MATKLSAYNGALRLLGQANISTLTDAVENRRYLDNAYDDDAIKHCLEQGAWNFAMRTVETNYDSSVSDPGFGFEYAFSKPSDWVRTVELASDEYFLSPLKHHEYVDEQSYWWADHQVMYVRYVSDDASYGSDLSLWPQTFTKYFEAFLAEQLAPRIFQNPDAVKKFEDKTKRALVDARSKDAMNEGAKFHPPGTWASARRGRGARRDRGSRSSLTG